MKKLILLASVAAAFAAFAATEVTWVGGETTVGAFNNANNWDPKVVPSSGDPDSAYKEGNVAYIAIFTNTVTITTGGNWFAAGFKVRNNATVTLDNSSVRPSNAIEGAEHDDKLVTDVETGSTLNFKGAMLRGRQGLTWVVKGGGVVKHSGSTGYNSAVTSYDYLRVESGEFHSPNGASWYTYFLKGVHIQDGGRFVCRVQNALNADTAKANHNIPVVLDAGGVYDCGGNDQRLVSLEGAGTVTNLAAKTLTLNLLNSGKTFSGEVYGKLTITPVAGETPADSRWIIGDTNTLAGCTKLTISTVSGCTTDLRFAAGIGTFYAQEVPTADFLDTDGKYVYIDRKPRWYVDGSRAESGDGRTAETAFKTIPEAYKVAQPYDKILVLPGVYADTPCSMDSTTSNRVTLASYVSMASTDGPEKTVILGAPPPSPDVNGLGDHATRCAWLGSGARLEGFTLTGGSTQKENRFGGGVLANDATAMIIDCIITNNLSSRGGGGANGTYVRCRIEDNNANALYGAVRTYDSVINANRSGYVAYLQANAGTFVNTTFGPDNLWDDDCRAGDGASNYVDFYNCVLMKGFYTGCQRVRLHRTFVTRTLPAGVTADSDCWVTNLTDKAEKMAAAGIGADLVPVLGSPLVDAGSNSYTTALYPVGFKSLAGKDASGGPRIRGAAVDVGAYEYDPSAGYPTVLALDEVARAALSVPSAAGDVVIRGDSKALRLTDAASLTVNFAKSSAATTTYTFKTEVAGTGTLSVYVNGAAEPAFTVTAANAGMKSVSDAAGVQLRFVYSGDGYADLSLFANETAFNLSVTGGGVTVTGATAGRNVIAYDSSATVTFVRTYDSEQLCTGLNVDGEYISFEDYPDGYAKTFLGTERSKVISVEAVYAAECHVWYVSPTGSDANKGYHRNAAWKTPVFAGTNGCVKSGDTVYLAAGEYTEGIYTTPAARRYRVCVPDNVTFAAADAPGSAVIVGAAATEPEDTYGLGLGADAVSCVTAGVKSRVIGLTLKDGRTPNQSNSYAGGVYGSASTVVEDCVFTNCASRRAGAVWSGICRRCRFQANNAAENTAVVENSELQDCVFFRNANLRALTYAYNCQKIRNCTFLSDKIQDTAANWGSDQRAVSNMVNCVLRCGQANYACYTHCAFLSGTPDYVHDENMDAESFRFTAAEAQEWLDDEGRPKFGAAFIDRGTVAAGYDGTLDADRSQRIYNGTIDLGAYEYDWRGVFASELTRRTNRLTVDAASANVTTNAAGGVLLADGDTLSATWTNKADDRFDYSYAADVTVSGAGTLVVRSGGVVIANVTAGTQTVAFDSENASGRFDFAFEGEGSAVVTAVKGKVNSGLTVIVR